MKTLRRGDYGVDAPSAVKSLGALALLGLVAAFILEGWDRPWPAGAALLIALAFALWLASFLYTTRQGKFSVWAELLDGLSLKGDETLLDVGCGRGAVLLLAAQRLPRGPAVGIDIWSTSDQSGNSEAAVLRNAAAEGVADRVELRTSDMRTLPFPDHSFDVVTSSLAIHNVKDAAGRERALSEILRVLKPGGAALIADIYHTLDYARFLAGRPDASFQVKSLGWRFWYGGPYMPTRLVRVARR
jgi:SAM-dependent methyltransferase